MIMSRYFSYKNSSNVCALCYGLWLCSLYVLFLQVFPYNLHIGGLWRDIAYTPTRYRYLTASETEK